jgi:hypothetical protein
LPEDVRKVIDLTHALITKFITFDPFPLNGLILRAMRKTQEDLIFTGLDCITFSPKKKLEVLHSTIKYLEDSLKMVLKRKVDSGLLNETINKVYEFAKEKLV